MPADCVDLRLAPPCSYSDDLLFSTSGRSIANDHRLLKLRVKLKSWVKAWFITLVFCSIRCFCSSFPTKCLNELKYRLLVLKSQLPWAARLSGCSLIVHKPPVLRIATQPWPKVFNWVKIKEKAIAKTILKVRFIINVWGFLCD